jgi:5'-nucleotidase / UDP-sugar diphosphatase
MGPYVRTRAFVKDFRLISAALLSLASGGCLQEGEDVDTTNPVRFSWLHTSDIHSRLIPYDLRPAVTDENLGLLEENGPFGGAARIAYLMKREKERSQRVLHLDSGDCFQGAPIFNFKKGEVEMRFMSLMRPDAVVIGNHEFDEGIGNYVKQLETWSFFPSLAANYLFPDWREAKNNKLGKYATPYELFNVEGVKVAIIGMANLSSLNSIGEGGNSLQIMPLEQNQILRFYVNMLRPSVDLVVVVSHMGLTEDEDAIRGYDAVVNRYCDQTQFSQRSCLQPDWEIMEELPNNKVRVFIPGVSDVDIIFGGHLHIVLNPPKVVEDPSGRNTLIVHSGAFAKYVGRLDTMIEDDYREENGKRVKHGKKVIAHKYQAFPVDNRLSPLEEANVLRMMQQYDDGLNTAFDLKRVVGYAPKTIMRASSGGLGDSPLGNLIAEGMRRRRRVEAQFAITNTLGIRDNIYAGPITLESLFNVMPFENTVTVMSISGYDVQDLFDFATVRAASRACNPQAQVAGMTYTQNCAQVLENQRTGEFVSPAEKITINGDPINLNSTYKMATNNYMAAGGSGFTVLKRNTLQFDTGVSLRDALVDYLRSFPTCRDFEAKNNVCATAGNDPSSQRLCADLQAYADVPCIESEADGRIQQQLVLSTDQGTVQDPTGDDRTNGDLGGGN